MLKKLIISILITLTITKNCNIDESKNSLGPNRCENNDAQCNGDRTCSQWRWCQGIANCHPDCGVNEGTNNLGANRCQTNHECDGKRTCSQWGWCQGNSGC